MEKIGDGKYRNSQGLYVVKIGQCADCALLSEFELCKFAYRCKALIGENNCFKKYEEPKKVKKIKLADVSFKCAVLTKERADVLFGALKKAGGWAESDPRQNCSGDNLILCVDAGMMRFKGYDYGYYERCGLPEVTLQQALDLLATVEKPEPVFGIKPFDKILCRVSHEAKWNCDIFNRIEGRALYVIGWHIGEILHTVKYEGNEALLGTTDTPSGWWEARDGKPVWVTRCD